MKEHKKSKNLKFRKIQTSGKSQISEETRIRKIQEKLKHQTITEIHKIQKLKQSRNFEKFEK